jgi:reversibly glycosylated polypeptide/UDP-arabinopyranose mutase
MNDVAVVIPTIRKECLEKFKKEWQDQFDLWDVTLIVVWDGDNPRVQVDDEWVDFKYPKDLIFNKNDGVRNVGCYYIAKYLPDIEYIITLDDDVKPIGDTIGDHIRALESRVPISWMNTADEYMRGFPYKLREEAEVVLSHGVWEGVKDWDAPTQLVMGNRDVDFYIGAIPKGIYYPMCGMNIAFKRKMLPYMYYAPMGYKVGMDRFADIWLGITSKRVIDKNNWAVVTGHAWVYHERASNVWKNLQKEAKGLELNETFWEGDESHEYFKLYAQRRNKWQKTIKSLLQED